MIMTVQEQKKQAKLFIERWQNRGNERQDSQPFWLDLLRSVYGIDNPETYISFEDKVLLDHTSFIDGYIDKTKVLIEQKGANKDLNKGIRQSDGSFLTPFQQAKRYSANLPYSQRPRWIVTCNFKEFYVYDMEQPNAEATVIQLADLEKECYRLEFLVDKTNEHLDREMQISMEAGDIVREIYDGLIKQYINPNSADTLHAINQLVVRLVFCLYAEDSGLFGHKAMFHDYLVQYNSKQFRRALIDFFEVLDTPLDERDPYLDEDLRAFPYVNGGMFAEKTIEIPNFTDDLRDLILHHASSNFDWSEISPTIFGAVFESTLNPETRRSGGMHYTSIENIHKVIDPLFLNALRDELNDIRNIAQPKQLHQRLHNYQEKLSRLTFFDPACGSGNFLTETYLSIRHLENEAIKLLYGDNSRLDTQEEIIKVHLDQFYGIEINDFAVSVAKTALWIAESQMMEKTKDIVWSNDNFLPLKSYTNIVEGNALTMDWEEVVPKHKLNYMIGNPPFVGARLMSKQQKQDLLAVFNSYKNAGNLDFVSGWYVKAARLMVNTTIQTALVSTNSITQGEQAGTLWKLLMEEYGVVINFAYRTFKWTSEANDKAAVHCVIVGFSTREHSDKKLIEASGQVEIVRHINGYLAEADDVFIESRTKPLCDVPMMIFGSMPNDSGYLSNYTEEEMMTICQQFPQATQFFKRIMGAKEFINNQKCYALWLYQTNPSEWRAIKPIMDAVSKVKDSREQSSRLSTKKLADVPYLFGEIRQPKNDYLIVPRVSSENRRYIPIGFMTSDILASDAIQLIPDASLYHFGVLTSNVHMAWMRMVAGRLESRYRYSAKIVYNNFPWVTPTDEQKAHIEQTAQAILDARALYPDSSLADLYDELTMPVELRKAHQANDRAVMEAYGLKKIVDGKTRLMTESETVARLFELYDNLTK